MSKNNNVNPGQYKVAGRERPGKDIPEPERAKRMPAPPASRSKSQRKRSAQSR